MVRPGHIFPLQLIALSVTVPALAHHISFTVVACADIAWWVEFLPSWNKWAFFPPLPVIAAALGFATDASGVGLGTVFGLKWLYATWPPAFCAYHINVLELFAVAVAVHCWGEEWHDTQILLHTDNMSVVQVWTTGTCVQVWTMGTCRCPHMSLVHQLFFSLAQHPCPPAAPAPLSVPSPRYTSCCSSSPGTVSHTGVLHGTAIYTGSRLLCPFPASPTLAWARSGGVPPVLGSPKVTLSFRPVNMAHSFPFPLKCFGKAPSPTPYRGTAILYHRLTTLLHGAVARTRSCTAALTADL